jgi:hypothetical protein
MPRHQKTDEQRAELIRGFQAARSKAGFAARTGVPVKTLYGWAAKARRSGSPAEPRPRAVSQPRTRVQTLPPPPAFDPGEWPAVLAAYEAVGVALDRVPPTVADAVLRTFLYRLHIPGLSVPPDVGTEKEANA